MSGVDDPVPTRALPSSPQQNSVGRCFMNSDPAAVVPARDYGFFGPGSVAWQVWGHAASVLMGFSRSVTMEHLDPALAAATGRTGKIFTNPRSRTDNTLRYFYTIILGDSESAVMSSSALVRTHRMFGRGIEPLSGLRYDANEPESQMWILMCSWHSRLVCYEKFGPGKLSESDDVRYWSECAVFAELQTCDPHRVPRNRAEVDEYFDRKRQHAALSQVSQKAMKSLVDFNNIRPPGPVALVPLEWIAAVIVRAAVISALPRWAGKLAGFRQPRVIGSIAGLICRTVFRRLEDNLEAKLGIITSIAPSAALVMTPMLRRVPAERNVILTPHEAFDRYGLPTPNALRATLTDDVGRTATPFPPDDPSPRSGT